MEGKVKDILLSPHLIYDTVVRYQQGSGNLRTFEGKGRLNTYFSGPISYMTLYSVISKGLEIIRTFEGKGRENEGKIW